MLSKDEIYKIVVELCDNYDFDGMPVKVKSINDGLYSDLKLDSLAVVEIIMLCENKFGIVLESEEIPPIKTVNDLINIIYEKLDYAEN